MSRWLMHGLVGVGDLLIGGYALFSENSWLWVVTDCRDSCTWTIFGIFCLILSGYSLGVATKLKHDYDVEIEMIGKEFQEWQRQRSQTGG